MNITTAEFEFLVEGLTTDLIRLLMERRKISFNDAVDCVYLSETYKNIQDPATGLYFQSPGYVYSYLETELNTKMPMK